jgi:hypothetical protein
MGGQVRVRAHIHPICPPPNSYSTSDETLVRTFKQHMRNRRALRLDADDFVTTVFDRPLARQYLSYIPHSRLVDRCVNVRDNALVFVMSMKMFQVNKVGGLFGVFL